LILADLDFYPLLAGHRHYEINGIDYLHTENRFAEFDREPLLPHMFSTESLAWPLAFE
jgi:hypothetical protein